VQGFGGYTCGCARAPTEQHNIQEGRVSHQQASASAESQRIPPQRLGGYCRGQPLGSPKTPGENPFSFANNETQTNSRNIKHVRYNHGPVAGARGPGGLSGPPERSAPVPLRRNSVSLEGHNAVLTRLRLARGLDAPSGKTPPRSRAGRPLRRDSVSLEALTSSPLPHPLPRPEHLMF
jgi:hypothetical protein